ncbi:MAG TPA: hypothetical protein VGQ36_03515 [Thermoanaerobaculia bacterium]|nr:hypothetical protein [Thermoanaerobaculia bacterium]
MKIAKHWEESGGFFVKLVDPRFGTTVDYAIRSLSNPVANGQRTNRVERYPRILMLPEQTSPSSTPMTHRRSTSVRSSVNSVIAWQ